MNLCWAQKLYNVSGFFALQSRYVGYYEILKNKYNLQLPPERQLKIKNFKIHTVHGKNSCIWAFLYLVMVSYYRQLIIVSLAKPMIGM